jgi:hypothetical protein
MNSDNGIMAALTREGVLLNVSVRYWRAARKLKPEDLGLDPERVAGRLVSLGHKRLLPREALAGFALIESRAHALAEANSFPFLNGIARFLPNRRLAETMDRLDGLEREFNAARRDFVARYAELREAAMLEWRQAAERLAPEPESVVAGVRAAFPPAEKLDPYFLFAVNLYQIRAPETLEAHLVSAGDQIEIARARDRAAAEAESRITAGVDGFVRDCVAGLREQTARLCEEMTESMLTGKTGVHQRTLNRLKEFIAQFKALNFAGDAELDAMLETVRSRFLTRTAESYRDDAAARHRLAAGIAGLGETAARLAREDAREIVENFGRLGARRFSLAA